LLNKKANAIKLIFPWAPKVLASKLAISATTALS